jgi:predicted AAA+ superfamily ATPase
VEGQLTELLRDKILAAAELPIPAMTRRDVSLPQFSGKAFAIIGMRRTGKTTFLHQCRSDLLASGRRPQSLVYFSFEDERLGEMDARQLSLIPDIQARLFPEPAQAPVTFFFDEIQRVPGWEVFARRLLDAPGCSVFLSGSSAKLLSREIATSMRGRAWEVAIHPFSFAEYLRHHSLEAPPDPERVISRRATLLDHHLARYLESGGFPEAQSLAAAERRQLLQNYVDVVLLRDVIERHGVTNVTALRWMVRRLLGSPAGLFSVSKFFTDLKSQGISVGREMLYEMLDHLADAFLLHTVPVATDSEKRRQTNPRKAYPADPALIPVFDRSGRSNIGHALENAVFIELLRRAAEVAYVKTAAGYEVDFLARAADGRQDLIQVCASVDDAATLAREIRALQDAAREYPGARQLLLVLESRLPSPEVPSPIRILPVWQWMLAPDA